MEIVVRNVFLKSGPFCQASQAAQLVRYAQQHGVEVRPVDANFSHWDCTLEDGWDGPAVPLGMRMVKGMREEQATKIADAVREHGFLPDLATLWQKVRGIRRASLVALSEADVFASMGLTRQTALWQARQLRDQFLPLERRASTSGEI